ncbi:MAG: hypothetical protein AAF554_05000 [Bacteroidota bacterium]
MKLSTHYHLAFICLFGIVTIGFSQQKVSYKGKNFPPAQVLEASIGNTGESFSFHIAEHDMGPNGPWAKEVRRMESQGIVANPEDAPKGYELFLSVSFQNTFKFPIQPEDSVFISVSDFKQGLMEREAFEKDIKGIDKGRLADEKNTLQSKKLSIEEKTRAISAQLQAGQISPQEAMKQIEALTNPLLEEVETAYATNIAPEEVEEKTNYSIIFMDTHESTQTHVFEGVLHIITFDKNKLIATLSGKHIVECMDVVRKNSPSPEACGQVQSSLSPQLQVLREEQVEVNINSTFESFTDNRN